MAAILLVDDETAVRMTLGAFIRHSGHTVTECNGVTHALSALRTAAFDLVLTDFNMTDGSGEHVLAAAAIHSPQALRVVMSGDITGIPKHVTRSLEFVLEKPNLLIPLRSILEKLSGARRPVV